MNGGTNYRIVFMVYVLSSRLDRNRRASLSRRAELIFILSLPLSLSLSFSFSLSDLDRIHTELTERAALLQSKAKAITIPIACL
jgi:hypothetical protein